MGVRESKEGGREWRETRGQKEEVAIMLSACRLGDNPVSGLTWQCCRWGDGEKKEKKREQETDEEEEE